ncbi:MAG: L-aspartate oxidase [Mariprofundaceae bacterium]
MNQLPSHFDYLIVGSGAAGLLAAYQLAPFGQVALINKGQFSESNTYQAQGGIASVLGANDSIQSHISDTIQAGAGLCHDDIVREVAEASAQVIENLLQLGTPFDVNEDGLHLTREGGHSHRRVVHSKDATGRAIGETLLKHVRHHKNIHCLQQYVVIDLITSQSLGDFETENCCLGAYILNPEQKVITLSADHIILATGGAGKVYMYTSNPHAATGDGIAMAWRAGCDVKNMEFMQFHPTCLYHASAPTMLLSEALRGEGAHLINASGQRFIFNYDSRGELAPRDVVAQAIDHEMKKHGHDCMYLDARHINAQQLLEHFPNIHEKLMALGLDMRVSPIPIVPAAHYMCGGVATSISGQTSIENLYVIGESACTGLHGANRLASNSLLECLVMAKKCSQFILKKKAQTKQTYIPDWDDSGLVPEQERIQIKQNWDEIRSTMSNYVGIVRSNERLHRARRRLNLIQEEISSFYWKHPVSQDLIELRNLALIAELIIRSAQRRKESRGLHFSTDYPQKMAKISDTTLQTE